MTRYSRLDEPLEAQLTIENSALYKVIKDNGLVFIFRIHEGIFKDYVITICMDGKTQKFTSGVLTVPTASNTDINDNADEFQKLISHITTDYFQLS